MLTCEDGTVPPAADDVPEHYADDDSPKEACGVFGVYAPGQPVAHLTYLGLYALQHRGQESAGMAVSDGDDLTVVKDMGLVSNVFDDRTLAAARRPPGHRPHPLLDHRVEHVAERPAGLPRRRRRTSSRWATTATWSTPRSWPPRPACCPGTVTSDTDLVAELLAARARRATPTAAADGRVWSARCCAVLPALRGRLLASC